MTLNTSNNRFLIALLIAGLLAGCAGRKKDGETDVDLRYNRARKRSEKFKREVYIISGQFSYINFAAVF